MISQSPRVERTCTCGEDDFECEFNHRRDTSGKCVLVDGAEPLPADDSCAWDQEFWFDRTELRKVPHSSCEGGLQLDRGRQHVCPAARRHGFFWWTTILLAPLMLAALFALWWYRRRGGRGSIRLSEPTLAPAGDGCLSTLASVPWWLIGMTGAVAGWVNRVLNDRFTSRRGGYRHLAVDDDAELLAEYDEE